MVKARTRKSTRIRQTRPPFAVQAFLDSADLSKTIVEYPALAPVFVQGDACDSG
jgi:hypothetical protein